MDPRTASMQCRSSISQRDLQYVAPTFAAANPRAVRGESRNMEGLMRRALLVLVLALTAFAIPATTLAGSGDILARGRGFGNFHGQVCGGTQCMTVTDFSFSAKANFNGTQASGRAVFENRFFNQKATADVTCLSVSPDRSAVVAGDITDISPSFGPQAQPQHFQMFVRDVAKPGDGVDQLFVTSFVNTTATCGPTGVPTGGNPIINGDILVDTGAP
jgi:hypothetical protein